VHTLEGMSVLSSRTLKWFSTQWPDFIRPHKNSLVNPAHVLDCVVLSHRQAYLLMRNGVQLPVGRRRIKEVSDQLRRQRVPDSMLVR
ncbi:MAG: LytTR family transcriptional regulator, partial [Cytophagaceae bacterium]